MTSDIPETLPSSNPKHASTMSAPIHILQMQLPDFIRKGVFFIYAGGETWSADLVRGCEILAHLERLCGDADGYYELLIDQDNWYVCDGRPCWTELPCGEDSDIKVVRFS